MNDVLQKQNYTSLLALGWDLVIAFFIGGALLTAIMTPLTYIFVKKAVIVFRRKKEKKLQMKRLKNQR
jgi:uncharacterized protein (DUF2062 family)